MPLPLLWHGGRAIAQRLFGGRAKAIAKTTAIGLGAGAIGERVFGGGGGGDSDGRRRRRRRRALTQGDRGDISFVAATLGKAAADRFASQIVAGNRG